MNHDKTVVGSPGDAKLAVVSSAEIDLTMARFDNVRNEGQHVEATCKRESLQFPRYRYYLIQVDCDRSSESSGVARVPAGLAPLAEAIELLEGEIALLWTTPGKFDLTFVLRMQSLHISIDAARMILNGLPIVKSLKITPVLPLDTSSASQHDFMDRTVKYDLSLSGARDNASIDPDYQTIIDALISEAI